MTNQNQSRNNQGEFANDKQDVRSNPERDRAAKERQTQQKQSGQPSQQYKPSVDNR